MFKFPAKLNAVSGVFVRSFASVWDGIHSSQVASLSDSLIQVDRMDSVIGPVPKLDSHLAQAVNDGVIHRAFSVFLFSRDTRALLIQKRCSSKIVFPREWANTCCSHPLYIESEMDNIDGTNKGIKRAASKRLHAELGISNFPLDSFAFKEKILYRQLSPGGTFGESECDYILIGEFDREKEPVTPVPDEVEETCWIEPGPVGSRTKNLRSFLQSENLKGFPPTPWFDLIVQDSQCLEHWWDRLLTDRNFLKDDYKGSIRSFF